MTSKGKTITLAHGNGGKAMHDLIEKTFLPALDNRFLEALLDSAILPAHEYGLAFTTDSYVVQPLFFPGGDIGRLAVSGTVNDLAVAGARPRYLSAAFVIEDGFPLKDMAAIVRSMKIAADEAGVAIVTGDTKVVPRGKADGLFVNTSGIGTCEFRAALSPLAVRPGDRVIVSGTLGDHAAAIMKARGDFPVSFEIESDCRPLSGVVLATLERFPPPAVRFMRDPTRGGLATTLVELARSSTCSIEIDESALPVRDEVLALCELTGYDPLYLANEGKFILVCEENTAEDILAHLGSRPASKDAAIIGTVTDDPLSRVYLNTKAGGTRIVDMLVADMLPRIC
ncbi:MAG: hydrogenase expression/formation protein HypE [Spirochaetales bacterium]|nr:hydrogenase expression/formation protein HypE [Spirochaetales bacterium]